MSSTSPQPGKDRQQALNALQRSRDTYLETIGSVPESAAGARLKDQGWSILEIAEHVAVAEHGMYRALELAVEKTTPADVSVEEKIIALGANRIHKLEAPDRSRPRGRWKTLAECVEAFKQSRMRTLALAANSEQLRGKSVQHPLLGELDGHQLLLVMATHAERHAAQVEEIKATAAYRSAVRG